MLKYVNGEYIEMTEEELAELMSSEEIEQEPTLIERLEAIESAILEGCYRWLSFLVIQIRLGKITIEDIPEKYKAGVEALLNK